MKLGSIKTIFKIHLLVLLGGFFLGALLLPNVGGQASAIIAEYMPKFENKKTTAPPSEVPLQKFVPNRAAILPKNIKNKKA